MSLEPLTSSTLRAVLVRLALPLLLLAGCASAPATLTLVDARGVPVEGALVFAPGALQVHRSDAAGAVTVPAREARAGLAVRAKGFHPVVVAAGDLAQPVSLASDPARTNPVEATFAFTRADTLRGSYGPYRANNDLLTYDLDVAVDVEGESIRGTNTIRFRMLEDGDRIQLDLVDYLDIDAILLDGRELEHTREHSAVFVHFPEPLRAGRSYAIDFHWSGQPRRTGRFGGMVFATDSLGHPWVYTANQNIGASVWWPNKDQQPDEVDSMTLRVTVPTGLVNVSNGRFLGSEDLGDGTTRFGWKIHYPINNYSVSINIGRYTHFADTLGDLTLDYYVMPYNLEAARRQFAQVVPMMECFQHHFGDFPFPRDGFKLIQVPYAGMEHQSAVTYGNQFRNGYLGRDWTGVGISPRFDFIIIHESGHEWFGNSVTANDVSDAWIHEGFTTYAEAVYVECMFGYDDAIRYVNGYQEKVGNQEPIIGPPGVNHWPTQDQYFKGALFLNTLRHVVADDDAWWSLLRDLAGTFALQNIWTSDVITFFNQRLGRDLRPVFEQYLYYANLPVLELEFAGDSVRHRWRAIVEDFDMPVRVRAGETMRTIRPTTAWGSEPLDGVAPDAWRPATDLFYIEVERNDDATSAAAR
jgi:aminopeptidase N